MTPTSQSESQLHSTAKVRPKGKVKDRSMGNTSVEEPGISVEQQGEQQYGTESDNNMELTGTCIYVYHSNPIDDLQRIMTAASFPPSKFHANASFDRF